MGASCSEEALAAPAAFFSLSRKRGFQALAFAALATCALIFVARASMVYMTEAPRVIVRTSSRLPFGVQAQSSRTCKRIKVPAHYTNETQGPYNPAAFRNPRTGEWLAVMTLDEIWFGISNYTRFGTYLEGRMRSHPLLLNMGNGTAGLTGSPLNASMIELDESYQELANAEGAQVYKAADWRPFVWRNEVYAGHWIGYMPGEERMAISRLDLQGGAGRLVHRFSTLSRSIEASLVPDQATSQTRGIRKVLEFLDIRQPCISERFRREKNWGFWEEDGKLLILYGAFPCTVVLEFNPERPSKPTIRSRTCYVRETISILQMSGLDIMKAPVHLSGNPVPWDIHRGSAHQELFVMLHTKHPEYVNWAVRIDRATHSITHITAGPLLRNQDYRNEGFLKTALVVSSFHVLPKEGSPEADATFVRIFYGEGDRYGCWLDIDTDTIVWHKLSTAARSARHNRQNSVRIAPL